MKRKRPTMKLWIAPEMTNNIYVTVHTGEPRKFGEWGWKPEGKMCSTWSIFRYSIEPIFGPLPPAGSRILVEFNLRTGKRTEWEPVP